MQKFSEPGVYYATGYRIIDASIRRIKGINYMAIKNEQSDLYGTIFIATSNSFLPLSWQSTEKSIAGTGAGYEVAEGPTWGYSYKDETYYIYFDEFRSGGVVAIKNKDLSNEDGWEYDRTCSLAPEKIVDLCHEDKLVSHCGIIDVTQNELDRLIEKWK